MTVQNFLNGTGTTHNGYSRDDVIAMDWDTYDQCSLGVSQWAFPSDEASKFVSGSPVLTADDIATIKADKEAIHGLCLCANFYYTLLSENEDKWLVENNHHHMRITRAIKALSIFVSPQFAWGFANAICDLNTEAESPVNETSVFFWQSAIMEGADYNGAG